MKKNGENQDWVTTLYHGPNLESTVRTPYSKLHIFAYWTVHSSSSLRSALQPIPTLLNDLEATMLGAHPSPPVDLFGPASSFGWFLGPKLRPWLDISFLARVEPQLRSEWCRPLGLTHLREREYERFGISDFTFDQLRSLVAVVCAEPLGCINVSVHTNAPQYDLPSRHC